MVGEVQRIRTASREAALSFRRGSGRTGPARSAWWQSSRLWKEGAGSSREQGCRRTGEGGGTGGEDSLVPHSLLYLALGLEGQNKANHERVRGERGEPQTRASDIAKSS